MKSTPVYDNSKHYWEQTDDVLQFYAEERNKIINGVNINGYHIHPWLYFHANYFHTPIPLADKTEPIIIPSLRDNEIFLCENYTDAERLNKGLIIYGSRRFAKSSNLASMLHWKAITKANSQATVSGGSTEDLEMITRLIQTSMTHVNSAFYMENNSNDWSKHIQLGLKTKSNTPLVYSDIYIRNLEKGQDKKSEKTAGAAPSIFILDECGKMDCIAPYTAALPSFKTPYGWKCVPILSGCVCAGTKVFNNKGAVVNIEDIKKSDGIIGYDGNKFSKEPITWIKPPAKKPCYRIETTGGNYLECSEDHPILTNCDKNKSKAATFKQAKDLKVGNYMFMPKNINIFGKKKFEHARMLGLLIADGHVTDYLGIELSCGEDEIYEYAKKRYKVKVGRTFETKIGGTFRRLFIYGIREAVRDAGMTNLVKMDKILPKNIDEYDKESVAELLAGYFDGDGNVKRRKKEGYNYVRISLTSISRRLLEEVKMQLIKFGIQSNIVKRITKSGYKPGSTAFVLSVDRQESIDIFRDNIKLLIEKKQSIIESTKNDTGKRTHGCKNIKIFKVNSEGKGRYFENKPINNVVQCSITKVEPIGEKEVYNLTAGKTHTYLANGFITHNTSGNKELSADAVKMMLNPETYDLLPMNWDRLESRIEDKDLITWKRRSFGIFVPGQFGYEEGNIKIETNLKNYLRIKEPAPLLELIKVQETDWKLAKSLFTANRIKLKKDRKEYDKYMMYYPLDVDDILLADNGNPFPIKEAQKHKQYLIDEGLTGKIVDLQQVGGKIVSEFSDKIPIEFPFAGGTHDAPVLLFTEIPYDIPPYALNVSGLDPYKQTKAGTDSVGAFYVLRREGLLDDPLAGCILASFASRPAIPDNFDRTCEWLIEAFNAQCLMENADIGFIRYLERKNKAELLLANGVDFSRRINPKASANTPYGLYPTPKNQSHLMKGLLNYCNEELIIGYDEDGTPRIRLGITRINDIYLLDEIINYIPGGNFDRMVAFAHALAWADYLDTIGVKVENNEQQEKRETIRKNKFMKYFTDTSKFNRWRN